MSKTSIITRTFNRLEYTVLCIRQTQLLAGNADYEHIIVDQNSTDGTREWLNSMMIEGFYKLKIKYNDKNTGDSGGMRDGFNLLSPDCKYILQLDQDGLPLTDNFINKLTDAMDNDNKIGCIMCKRIGVKNHLEMGKLYSTFNGINFYYMPRPHAVFFRKNLLEKINYWISEENIGWVKTIPNKIQQLGLVAVKTPDILIEHMDTTDGQRIRYPKYFANFTSKTSNYNTINYNKLK